MDTKKILNFNINKDLFFVLATQTMQEQSILPLIAIEDFMAISNIKKGGNEFYALALFAYLIGAIIGLILLISCRKKFGSQLPFGTFLALGTTIGIWWGNGIINWYLGLL